MALFNNNTNFYPYGKDNEFYKKAKNETRVDNMVLLPETFQFYSIPYAQIIFGANYSITYDFTIDT